VCAPAEPSPLAATLARASQAEAAGIRIVAERRDAPGDGWVAADALGPGGAELGGILAAGMEATAGLPHVAAAWLLERDAWLVSALLGLTVLGERRVPDLAPSNVLIGFHAGVPYGIATRSDRMSVPRDDPAAERPDVTVCGDERALRAQVRAESIRLLGALVEGLAALRLRGRRALWRAAGDRLVQGWLWAGAALDRQDDAIAIARELLSADSPLRVPVSIANGAAGPFQQRSSCCLAYRVEGMALCLGCPLARRRVRS
jgi:FhuF 2Fe-2S C-terminal domain/Ferric iron reductase FhuF-like transporter